MMVITPKHVGALIFMDMYIVDDLVEIQTRCSFVIEFIIPKFKLQNNKFYYKAVSCWYFF
jgi:hypothetical protein